jgi:hypothetical protein
MTLAQIEERLTALEKEVALLRAHLPQTNGTPPAAEQANGTPPVAKEEDSFLREEDIIPGAEYDVVIDVPPQEVVHLTGRIVRVVPGPCDLGLSDAEWASLGLEDDDD